MNILHFLMRFFIGYFITISVIFVTQWTYYTYFDSFIPPSVVQPIKVTTPVVEKGGQLGLSITFTKPQDVYIDSRRQIICDNGDIAVLASSTVQLPITLEYKTVNITIPIPKDIGVASDQNCIYRVRGTAQINPVIVYTVDLVSEPFYLKEEQRGY